MASLLFAGISSADNARLLTIGALRDLDALPYARLARDASLGFALTPVPVDRSEAFPAWDSLPDILNQLPDIVDVLVSYRHNDIKRLVDEDAIVPLDSFFEEIGINAKDLLPHNVYGAVEYRGHIWALPHRLQLFVLTWDKPTCERLKIDPNVSAWEEVLAAGKKILSAGVPAPFDQAFSEGNRLSKEHHIVFFLSMLEGNPGSVSHFLGDYMMSGVMGSGEPSTLAPITLQGLSSIGTAEWVTPAPASSRLYKTDTEAGPTGFLECYALRKNTPEKLKTGREFLRWLTREQTQILLLELSNPDTAPAKRELDYCHVPLYTPVLKCKAFEEILARNPFYRVMSAAARTANFTTPIEGDHIENNKDRYEEACRQLFTGRNMFDRLEAAGRLIADLGAGKEPAETGAVPQRPQPAYSNY
jgi:hypothetical protein